MKKLVKATAMAAIMLAVFLCVSVGAAEITLLTNSAGAVNFEDLPVGTYDVLVSMDGYYSKQTTAQIVAMENQNHIAIDVMLDEITHGTVTVNTGLQDASVKLDGLEQRTDADGKTVFANVPVGDYQVEIYKTGYYKKTVSVSVVKLEGQEYPIIDVTLFQITQGTLTVKTVDSENNPIDDVEITIDGTLRQSTGWDGQTLFDALAIGNYDISAYKDGYYTQTGSADIIAIEGQEHPSVTLALTPITHGTVTIDSGLEGVTVTVNGVEQITGADGKTVFVDVPVGEYQVTAYKDGYFTNDSVWINVIAIEGQEHPSAGVVLTPVTHGSIKINVYDRDGNPLEGAVVTIEQL